MIYLSLFMLVGLIVVSVMAHKKKMRNRNTSNQLYNYEDLFQGRPKVSSKFSSSTKVISARKKNTSILSTGDTLLYKDREIRYFGMRGMYYQNDLKLSNQGWFQGYVVCEENSHDKYAVAVYNDQSKMLGYIPKNNKRINDSLKHWHRGRLFCWGVLEFDDFKEKWHGGVYIPVGLPDDEISAIKQIFVLQDQLYSITSQKDLSISDQFKALKINKEIHSQIKIIKKPKGIMVFFPKTIIPSLSKRLERNKMWEKLLELDKYKDEINNLSDVFAKATNRRIEQAKKRLGQ